MILKASQRGGAAQLGVHLLKQENEQVELHEIRGFMADDVKGAFKEAQAVARGTRCKQFLFSVSLNPPANENVAVDAFEAAIERIETRTGLSGQPRVVIFHEKEGRRHAHCVWSRIDAATMTAKPMSFFKVKLREVSKELYLEHGWQLPRGFLDSRERDPTSFSLAEWQQAKRMARDPAALKATVQECWAASDSGNAFAAALETRGLYLSKGDRRGHVAVTYEGEVLSIARLTGKRAKEITAKLGSPDALRSVAETRAHIASVIAPKLEGLIRHANAKRVEALAPLEAKRLAMRDAQKAERRKLDDSQKVRAVAEAKTRNARLRSGALGLWDRLTGRRADTIRQNEADALQGRTRDRAERHDLISGQLDERRALQRDIRALRDDHAAIRQELHRDLSVQREAKGHDSARPTDSFNRAATSLRRTERPRGERSTGRDHSPRARGPDLGR